jgi:xanthine dehydrogenase accessory factor
LINDRFPVICLDMKNIYLQILENQSSQAPMALATVTRTAGSTPQKPGSSALFGLDSILYGTIGGGAVEEKVKKIVQTAVLSKESGLFEYELDNDISHIEEPICGGKMNILVDAAPELHQKVFEQLKQSLLEGEPGILVTKVSPKNDRCVEVVRYWSNGKEQENIPLSLKQDIEKGVRDLLAEGRKGKYTEIYLSREGEVVLLEPLFPPARLVIAGAGHIGKALTHLGKLLDFEVTIIDDREEYANLKNLPDADRIVVDDIGKAFQELKKTPDTYIVIVTRGHKCDADALKYCIGSDIAYIGMIGSAKKVAEMRKKFIEEGWSSPKQWKEIHAPIGLPINSQSVQEIAVSIAAQLVQVRNGSIPH